MADTVHPNDFGHTLYTETIVAWLEDADRRRARCPEPVPGAPLVSEEFANVALVAPSKAKLNAMGNAPGRSEIRQDRPLHRSAINAQQPGTRWSLEFDGTALGLYLTCSRPANSSDHRPTASTARGVPNYGRPSRHETRHRRNRPVQYFPRYNYALLTTACPPVKSISQLTSSPTTIKSSTGNRLLIGLLHGRRHPAEK